MKIVLNTNLKQWTLILVCFLASWVLSLNLYAQPSKKRVIAILQGYEWSLNADSILKLGDDVDLTLMEVAADNTLMNAYRFRALQALSLFNQDRVADYLENHINKNKSSSHLRRAFESLSQGFSSTQPQRVEEAALKLLSHKNPNVRISAAKSLNQLNTTASQSAYSNYMSLEKEDWIKKAIEN